MLKSMTNIVLSPNFVTFWPFYGLLIDQQPGPLFLRSISAEKKKALRMLFENWQMWC